MVVVICDMSILFVPSTWSIASFWSPQLQLLVRDGGRWPVKLKACLVSTCYLATPLQISNKRAHRIVPVLSVAAGKCYFRGYLKSGIHLRDMWRKGNTCDSRK